MYLYRVLQSSIIFCAAVPLLVCGRCWEDNQQEHTIADFKTDPASFELLAHGLEEGVVGRWAWGGEAEADLVLQT